MQNEGGGSAVDWRTLYHESKAKNTRKEKQKDKVTAAQVKLYPLTRYKDKRKKKKKSEQEQKRHAKEKMKLKLQGARQKEFNKRKSSASKDRFKVWSPDHWSLARNVCHQP
jgi:hypothetical protein